jgi:hypothetical protein
VLSGRDPCDKLITRPEESYRLWCAVAGDLESPWTRRPCPPGGGGVAVAPNKKTYIVERPKRYLYLIFNKFENKPKLFRFSVWLSYSKVTEL